MIARWDATDPDDILRTDAGAPSLIVVSAYQERYRHSRMVGMGTADSHDEAMNAARLKARELTRRAGL